MQSYLEISICFRNASTLQNGIGIVQKINFSVKDFFSECEQIHRNLRICLCLLNTSFAKSFIFCSGEWSLLLPVWQSSIFPFWISKLLFYHKNIKYGLKVYRGLSLRNYRIELSIRKKQAYRMRQLNNESGITEVFVKNSFFMTHFVK